MKTELSSPQMMSIEDQLILARLSIKKRGNYLKADRADAAIMRRAATLRDQAENGPWGPEGDEYLAQAKRALVEIVNEPSISEQREMGVHFGACD